MMILIIANAPPPVEVILLAVQQVRGQFAANVAAISRIETEITETLAGNSPLVRSAMTKVGTITLVGVDMPYGRSPPGLQSP